VSISVRTASPGDFPAVARLTVAAYDADGQLAGGNGYERTLANVAARADAGQLLVAADPTGAILGAVLFVLPGSRYSEVATAGEGEFRMLAVDPAAQGRGVGRALVLACLDCAAATGCRAVVICVRDTAATAQRLYARLGFLRVAQLDWSPLPDVHLLALRREMRIPAGHV
jgi:ribosomal protein S18 acetylase RimI-like enzyme